VFLKTHPKQGNKPPKKKPMEIYGNMEPPKKWRWMEDAVAFPGGFFAGSNL